MNTSKTNSPLNEIYENIVVYKKMRQIQIPLSITISKTSINLLVSAEFRNTKLALKSTTLETMYKEAVKFIEEMNNIYINNNKEYNPTTTKEEVNT